MPGDDWVYQVTVTDVAQRTVFQREVRGTTECAPGDELLAMLTERHATFHWSVAIVSPDGRALASSPPVAFSVR